MLVIGVIVTVIDWISAVALGAASILREYAGEGQILCTRPVGFQQDSAISTWAIMAQRHVSCAGEITRDGAGERQTKAGTRQ